MGVHSSIRQLGVAFAISAIALAGCGGSDDDATGPDAASGNGNGNGNGNGDGVDRVSYTSEANVPPEEDDEWRCCKDFGEISDNPGEIDNAYAELADLLSLGGVDLEEGIENQIQDGNLVILMNHLGVSEEGATYDIEAYLGAFAEGTIYEDAKAGDGEFEIEDVSFDDQGNPQVVFEDAVLQDGELQAGPTNITLAVGVGEDALTLDLRDTELRADASFSNGGIQLDNGELSAYLLVDDLFEALNDFLESDTCQCLGVGDDPVFVQDGPADWSSDCREPEGDDGDGDGHTCEEDDICAVLGSQDSIACTVGIPTLLPPEADLDTSDDGTNDALSIGLEWVGVPGTIVE